MPLDTEVSFHIGLGPGDIVLDGDPTPPRKGAQQPPPTFRLMSIVAKRSPISATAELLLHSSRQRVYTLQWDTPSLLKLPLPMGDLDHI